MFFTISGSSAFRFKKPSMWFIWFIQKPLAAFIAITLASLMIMAALIALIVSAIAFINDIFDQSGERPNSLAAIGTIIGILFYGWLFFMIFDRISTKRKRVADGHYRDYYVTQHDFSFQIMFLSGLQRNHEPVPGNVLSDIFSDQDIAESDGRLRRFNLENPEDLRFRRLEQMKILNLIQGFYLRAGVSTHGNLAELQSIRRTADAMTHHLAHDLLDTYNGRRESLMELIIETRPQAS